MTLNREQARAFASLVETLQKEKSREATLEAATALAAQMVPGCDYAGVTITHHKRFETAAPTDQLVLELDRKQYEIAEGPSIEAARTDEFVLIADTSDEPRWPRWSPFAAQAGIGSVLSVHLGTIARSVGALNLYSRNRRAFDADARFTAHIFAVHAAGCIVAADKEEGLTIALRSRHQIGLAQGMLMARYQLSEEQAFRFLVRTSQSNNVKVHDLARDVIRELSAAT